MPEPRLLTGPPLPPPSLRTAASPHRAPAPEPSRTTRQAWFIPGAILAIGSLAWGTFNVLSLLAHEERTETTVFDAAQVTALDVASDNGSVRVSAGSGDEIVVVAEISDGWKPTSVSTRVVDGVLEIRGGCSFVSQWCDADFHVTLPADRTVTVDASNGSVHVAGMAGPIDVDNDNGSIELEDVSGDIVATNDNGRIVGRRLTASRTDASTDNGRIELSFLDPPDVVSARTSNGRIEVIAPDDDVAYRVTIASDNGSTDNGVRTDATSSRVIDLTSDNGSIVVRPPG